MYNKKVGQRGSSQPQVLIVGEAPGRDEEASGQPFVGASGQELDSLLTEAGLDLASCRWANVCNYRPPNNKIDNWFYAKSKAPRDSVVVHDSYVHPFIAEGLKELLWEIDKYKPQLIIALGNTPLWALTGHWGITNWRGSQMTYTQAGHKCRLLPTYHPAAILRQWSWRNIAVQDLRRARNWLETNQQAPAYNFCIRPSDEQVYSTLDSLMEKLNDNTLDIAVDLETRGGHIACIGLAWSKHDALCIPLMDATSISGYWPPEVESVIVRRLHAVIRHENAHILGQNYLYDLQYLIYWYGIEHKCSHDTMTAQRLLFPALPKDLGFLSSMYCDWHEYWKEEGKFFDLEHHDENRLWTYNCKDAVTTWEVTQVERELIKTQGLSEQWNFEMEMFHHLLAAMLKGVRVDTKYKANLLLSIMEVEGKYAEWFTKILPSSVFPQNPKNKPWYRSPVQQMRFFYDTLGIKEVRHHKTFRPTVDDDALKIIRMREPLLAPITDSLSNYRSLDNVLNNVILKPLDYDGRMRCSYNQLPNTFRLSSSENAFGRGCNLQAITAGDEEDEENVSPYAGPDYIKIPNLRKIFVPDPGHIICEVDLQKADLMVVIYEAEDDELKQMAKSGVNMHIENAKAIFGGNPTKSSSPNSSYHKAKQGVHLTNYGGQPATLARELGITKHEADIFQSRWFAAHPGIKKWQDRVQNSLDTTRTVNNRFGYRIRFFDRPADLLDKALAWVPQSTVAIVINKGWANINLRVPEVTVLMQVHDSLVVQIPFNNKTQLLQQVKNCMEIVVPYADPLVIALDFKMSEKSWGDASAVRVE